MALGVHYFTDLVNLQTVCKIYRLASLYIYGLTLPKYVLSFAFCIPEKIAACTKHNCGCNVLKIILLKNLFEFIVLVSSMRVKNLPEIFLFRFVPLVYFPESTHMYVT